MKSFLLTDEQLNLAKDLAQKIKDSKEYTKFWKIDNIVIGILGEMAYAQLKSFNINENVWSNYTDGGIDFLDGTDVKTITYCGPNPELKLSKIPKWTRKQKLVLAICDYKNYPNKVDLVGEISFEHFKERATLRTYGDKSWHAVTPDLLDVIYTNEEKLPNSTTDT
jgi:hypothetical protein